MNTPDIERAFQEKVCDQVRLMPEGLQRYRVFTPFRFDDGDHLAIVLKQESGQWVLSDEGHTYMHLTYEIDERDLQRGTRQRIITNALSVFQVEDRSGELVVPVVDDQFGDALYSFVQGLLRISDVTFLSRELVRSTFAEDFRTFVSANIPEDRRQFDWFDPQRDPDGKYTVNCRLNGGANQLLVYALQSDDQTRDANIALLEFEKRQMQFQSVAIFENQEEINRRVLARFTDVCDKQYSSLSTNRDRINQYLRRELGITDAAAP